MTNINAGASCVTDPTMIVLGMSTILKVCSNPTTQQKAPISLKAHNKGGPVSVRRRSRLFDVMLVLYEIQIETSTKMYTPF